jgi:hypothetical protein
MHVDKRHFSAILRHPGIFTPLWLTLLLLGGCSTMITTNPPQTANEQFLLSQSTSEAISKLSTANLRGRTVFLNTQYLDMAYPNPDLPMPQFLIADLRAHLLAHGVRLVSNQAQAQIILEVRCGAQSVNQQNLMFGIPALAFGSYTTGTATGFSIPVAFPQIAFLQNVRQSGYTSIAYVAYWQKTGEIVASSGPYVGRTYRSDWWIFGFGPQTSGNIPPAQKQ